MVENNVQLPDEYDQIFIDLEAFWGIEPSDLIQLQKEGELKQDSYTIGKNEEGEVEVLTYAFQEGKYDQLIAGSRAIINLFKPIQEHLPPFRMTLSPHDAPNRLSDYSVKAAAREAADSQTCEHPFLFIYVTGELTSQRRHSTVKAAENHSDRMDICMFPRLSCSQKAHQSRQTTPESKEENLHLEPRAHDGSM